MDNMSFIVYRRPRAISLKDTKQAITFDRTYAKTTSTYQPVEPLLLFEDLPGWNQDNPYIRVGYRNVNLSYGQCLRSCTRIHNETMNIITHLVPAVLLMFSQYSLQQAISYYYPEATVADRAVFAVNVLAATITFTLSSVYHTLICHSEDVSRLWLRIDYVGILILILGSFFSAIHVGFYREPGIRNLYWSMITAISVVTATLVLHPRLQNHRYRAFKAYAFVATALTGFAPISHGLYLYGWSEMWVRSGMPFYFLEGVVYLSGVFFFVTHFPESKWPGYFDIYLNSHAIFHLLVVCASFVHMYGVWSAYAWNYQTFILGVNVQ